MMTAPESTAPLTASTSPDTAVRRASDPATARRATPDPAAAGRPASDPAAASAVETGSGRPTVGPTPRIAGLDALRGFALAGIVFVNIGPILGLSPVNPDGATSPVYLWLQDFVQGRFFPIFSLLFGLSLAMVWESAMRRAPGRPRAVLVRRLAFLGLLGAAHQLLQPGEALLPYALAGLVLLVPATYLPAASASSRRWTAGLLVVVGTGLLAAGALTGGGLAIIPGLFLLGCALGLQRVPARLSSWRHTSWVAGSLTVIGVSAILLVFAATTQDQRLVSMRASAAFGLLMAATYVCGFVFLLTTPVRAALVAAFAPLGRMACTNYVAATLLIVGFRFVFLREFDPGVGSPQAWRLSMLFCLVLLALQWGCSVLWLKRFAQGPVEYAWRWATWLERPRWTHQTVTSVTPDRL